MRPSCIVKFPPMPIAAEETGREAGARRAIADEALDAGDRPRTQPGSKGQERPPYQRMVYACSAEAVQSVGLWAVH